MTTRCRVLASVAVVALVVLTLQGFAVAKTVPASTWSKKFCTTLEQWQGAISDGSQQVQTALGGVTDLTEAKSQLTSFLGQMTTETDHAQTSLKRVGAPNTPNGQKIASTFVNALGRAKSIFAKARSDAAALSTTDASAFESQALSISNALTGSADQLTKSFTGINKLDKGLKLSAVLEKTKACAFLSGGK